MFFRKQSLSELIDYIEEACADTGVGVPEEINNDPVKSKEYYDEYMCHQYNAFAEWLYQKRINIEKEIDFFDRKYLSSLNSREASHQVLSYFFCIWKRETLTNK